MEHHSSDISHRAISTDVLPHSPVVAAASPAVALARSHRRLQVISTSVALAILLVVNVVVQMNRTYFDAQSDIVWGMRRVLQCESLGRSPDLIYLGSSRTVEGISPRVIDGIVQEQTGQTTLGCNVGTFGSSMDVDYFTLKRLYDDGIAPKIIVESIYEWNFNVNAPDPADGNPGSLDQVFRLATLGDLDDLRTQVSGLSGTAKLAEFVAGRLVPVYGDRLGLLSTLCGSHQIGPCASAVRSAVDPEEDGLYRKADRQGWVERASTAMTSLTPASRQELITHLQQTYFTVNHRFEIGGHQWDALERIFALAKAHGAQVVLAYLPLHPLYLQYAFDRPQDEQMVANACQQFAQAHDVPFYDRSRDPNFVDADYNDPSHLSAAGGVKFSSWLATNVIAPMLATASAPSS
jgi:hypothetical protein